MSRNRPALRVAAVAVVFAAVMAGTTLPTPLYPLYEAQFGFGPLTVTIVYAVYAVGVLAALVLFGRASDVIGRRPVLLTAIALSAASAALFLTDASVALFVVGRVLSGLSAGLVTAAATAGMIEQAAPDRRRGATMAASVINMLGLGLGPLVAGIVAEYGPSPLRLTFVVDLVLLVVAAVVWLGIPESVPAERRAGLSEATRPQRPGVPDETRSVFLPSAVAGFAGFAVLGLTTAIEPGLLATVLHQRGHLVAGLGAFLLFGGSAAGQVASARIGFRRALPTGCLLLVAGLVLLCTALLARSVPVLFAAVVVVGGGQGVSFRAGMAAINATAPAERRGETVSAYMIVAYTAISVPVVLVGVLSVLTSLRTAALVFSAAVAVLAVVAAAGVRRVERPSGERG